MPLLVDGDNLLGTWPGRKRSDAGRRELARLLFRYATGNRRKVVVVFDGPRPPVPPPTPDVHYSGGGHSADDLILTLLREERDPRGWTVITSDRSLADQCRYVGARVERSDRFRRRLLQPAAEDKPDGPVDVDDWMDYFGVSDDESV
jgi:predicted RNA-binding protein with PIN domain